MLTKLEILEKLPTATKEERRELLKLARELDNSSFKNTVIHGDCLEVLKTIPDNYFDSLITDPPGGINFMQKQFDSDRGGMLNWINWLSEIMSEAMRTMKPGACGLVWSIPRTSHWTGMALELAGFRLIDIIHACNGSGFPKGQDISKGIDALYGAERKVIGLKVEPGGRVMGLEPLANKRICNPDKPTRICGKDERTLLERKIVTAPSTPEAKKYDGWKTPALKPAVEGWWLVQKPISESSIARNILKHGVGGINVEACRIDYKNENVDFDKVKNGNIYGGNFSYGKCELKEPPQKYKSNGRYPANLILSCDADCEGDNHSPDCPVSVIGEQSGICTTGKGNKGSKDEKYFIGKQSNDTFWEGDTGTAARYFKQLPFDPETVHSVYYQAKASTKDRSCNGAVENIHPTVKSRYLMQYLIKLITPPDSIVLDPFGGSGTTAVAAKESGFNYVLIEKEQEYVDIINKRIEATTKPDKP